MAAKFTAADTLQQVEAEFKDADGGAVDITSLTPKVIFKVDGTDPDDSYAIVTKTMSKVLPYTDGVARYTFLGPELVEGVMTGEFRLVDGGANEITSVQKWTATIRPRLS